jgi:hypothetical protein
MVDWDRSNASLRSQTQALAAGVEGDQGYQAQPDRVGEGLDQGGDLLGLAGGELTATAGR